MAYIDFLKDKAGLGDQVALASNVQILAEKLTPWALGGIYRTHAHIRDIARKMLTSRSERLDEQKVSVIVEALAERIFQHGHGISRREASDLGLPVDLAEDELLRGDRKPPENVEDAKLSLRFHDEATSR